MNCQIGINRSFIFCIVCTQPSERERERDLERANARLDPSGGGDSENESYHTDQMLPIALGTLKEKTKRGRAKTERERKRGSFLSGFLASKSFDLTFVLLRRLFDCQCFRESSQESFVLTTTT